MKRAHIKPGFRISQEQFHLFWRLFSQASAVQGWDRLRTIERDEKRRELLRFLGWQSLKDVDRTKGFDDLKKRLLELADIVVNPGPDRGQPVAPDEDDGDRRRVVFRIQETADSLAAAEFPDSYLIPIFKNFGMVNGWLSLTSLKRDGERGLIALNAVLQDRLISWNRAKHRRSHPRPAKPVQTLCNLHAAHLPDAIMATPDLFFAGG
jgi:hypothetical protein